MTSRVTFNEIPIDVLPGILDVTSMEKSSELLNCRLTSKTLYNQCEVLLKALWDQMKLAPPMGKVVFALRMYGIDSYSSNPVSAFVKFRKLASIYRIDLNIIPSPIRTRDFQNGLY